MRGLWLSLCMVTSFPNFASFVFICQFQGFLFGAILVHARHRETTGVLNGSPQFGFGFGLCLVLLGICVKEQFFLFFCDAEPGEKQDHGSDGKWWKGYSRGRSW